MTFNVIQRSISLVQRSVQVAIVQLLLLLVYAIVNWVPSGMDNDVYKCMNSMAHVLANMLVQPIWFAIWDIAFALEI